MAALQSTPPGKIIEIMEMSIPPDNFKTPLSRRIKRRLNSGEHNIDENDMLAELLSEIKSLKSIVVTSDSNIRLILKDNLSLRKEVDILKSAVSKMNMDGGNVTKEITKEIQKAMKDGKKVSYAETVKVNEPVVIIVPKDSEQKSNVTKAEIKNKISPTSNKVSGMRNASKGAIVVECTDKKASEKLKNEALAKLGDKYEVKIPVPKNPRFKIINMCDKLSEEAIINNIKKQNDFVDNNAALKVIKIIEAKNKRFPDFTAIIETDINTCEQILKNEKLSIGWDRCRVFEHVYVSRCYKCLGFNHMSDTCTNKKACLNCAGEHEIKDCVSDEIKCVNCIWAVANLDIRLDVNHRANSNECSVLQKRIDRERKKIYSEK